MVDVLRGTVVVVETLGEGLEQGIRYQIGKSADVIYFRTRNLYGAQEVFKSDETIAEMTTRGPVVLIIDEGINSFAENGETKLATFVATTRNRFESNGGRLTTVSTSVRDRRPQWADVVIPNLLVQGAREEIFNTVKDTLTKSS